MDTLLSLIPSLLDLVPSEHRMAVLGWLWAAGAVVWLARKALMRWFPRAAANGWVQALDALAQLALLSSKRLVDHDTVTSKLTTASAIDSAADKATELVNRRSAPPDITPVERPSRKP